ncbi:MAG TPA: DNA gyrase inhibitor YacG [Terracidiphilus sp.]|nr:DNA gyrase inhibitor YacG [Terracidiphilus sp.]
MKCPTCKQTVAVGAEDFPFCSARCRLLDLGKWASGKYVVSSPVQDISDLLEHSDIRKNEDE